jgi:hypothetical protein
MGADMRVMASAPDAALAEFCRVLQDLRDQVRRAGGEPAGPDLSPDQKAAAAGKFYDAHAGELSRLGVKRQQFIETHRRAPSHLAQALTDRQGDPRP